MLDEKILFILKNSIECITGEELSEMLNVSSCDIFKNINKLREDGYTIISKFESGYKLEPKHDVISEAEIKLGLNNSLIGKKIFCYRNIGSTNEQAKIFANKGFKEGTVIISESQTDGRGRLGRKWESDRDVGIYMSIILKPNISIENISQITLLAGIAVCNAIQKETNLKPMLKWPNDIIINSKKVCGILTELNAETNKINYLVTGIGVNINNTYFDSTIKDKASSLFLESKSIYSRRNIVVSILSEFEIVYEKFKLNTFNYFVNYYKSICLNLNRKVIAISQNNIISGTAIDIKNDGSLVIKLDDGSIVCVSCGEVSLQVENGYI